MEIGKRKKKQEKGYMQIHEIKIMMMMDSE